MVQPWRALGGGLGGGCHDITAAALQGAGTARHRARNPPPPPPAHVTLHCRATRAVFTWSCSCSADGRGRTSSISAAACAAAALALAPSCLARSGMARAAIAAALLLLAAWQAASHPDCWAAEFAPDCFAVPTKPYACHKGPEVDKGTSLSVAGKVCAGKPFTLSAKFPTARHAYVTFSAGVVVANKNEFNVKCPNTFAQAPETGYKGVVSALPVAAVAPSKPGTMIRATVASSTGPCAPYLITSASFKVEAC